MPDSSLQSTDLEFHVLASALGAIRKILKIANSDAGIDAYKKSNLQQECHQNLKKRVLSAALSLREVA